MDFLTQTTTRPPLKSSFVDGVEPRRPVGEGPVGRPRAARRAKPEWEVDGCGRLPPGRWYLPRRKFRRFDKNRSGSRVVLHESQPGRPRTAAHVGRPNIRRHARAPHSHYFADRGAPTARRPIHVLGHDRRRTQSAGQPARLIHRFADSRPASFCASKSCRFIRFPTMLNMAGMRPSEES